MFDKSIDVTVTNSTVHGDVVGGDKVVHIHLHESKLTSMAALIAEVARHGIEANSADELVAVLLKDQKFREKLDAAWAATQEQQVDEAVTNALAEYERTGPTPKTIEALEALATDNRRRGQFLSYARVVVFLLQFYDRDPVKAEAGLRMADEVIGVLRDHPSVARYIAWVRAYQAKHLFFKYTDGLLRLRTVIAANELLPVRLPLVGLVEQQRNILGNRHLADAYLCEAIEVALNSGDASLSISVLFEAEHIQEHAYFFEKHALRRDGVEQAERVFRSLKLLDEMVRGFGDAKEAALVTLNAANFHLLLEQFDVAATLAMAAAQKLSALGQSYYASKALRVLGNAQRREPTVTPPSAMSGDEALQSMSGADFEAFVRELSERMIAARGIDLRQDASLREAIECAWRDINPGRVMRCCEQLALSTRTSLLGESIGLPTLGMKAIRCMKYGWAVEGAQLDRSFGLFKERHCDSCPSRQPRPADWQWSPKDSMPKPP